MNDNLNYQRLCEALKFFNAVIVFKLYPRMRSILNNKVFGSLREVLTLKVPHIYLKDYFIQQLSKYQLYPRLTDTLRILSVKQKIFFIERLEQFFGLASLVFFIICTALVLFLKYTLGQSICNAFIQLVILAADSPGTVARSDNKRSNLIFLFLLIGFVPISTILQGFISAMLTAPTIRSDINSVEDFLNTDKILHGTELHKQLLVHEELVKRYQSTLDARIFSDFFMTGKPDVVLLSERYIPPQDEENKFYHVSREPAVSCPTTYPIVEDFPLVRSLNLIMQKLTEGGFMQRIFSFNRYKNYRHHFEMEGYLIYQTKNNKDFSSNLFCLVAAYGLSTAVFLIEFILSRVSRR